MGVMLHGGGSHTPVWVFVDDDLTDDELEATEPGCWDPVGPSTRQVTLDEAIVIAADYTGGADGTYFGEDDERNGMAAALTCLAAAIADGAPVT